MPLIINLRGHSLRSSRTSSQLIEAFDCTDESHEVVRGDGGGRGGRWSISTAHLGVRFASDYAGPGLKVRDVLPEGPAARAASKIEAGEIVLSIDGKSIDPAMDLTLVLNGVLDRDVRLRVKAADGKLSYGSGGVGSLGHLSMALLLARAGLKMDHVPYQGGGPAMNDVVAGQLPFYFANLSEGLPHVATLYYRKDQPNPAIESPRWPCG